MRAWMLVVVGGLGLAVPVGAGQAQHREAGAHVHGRGTLNIALEGARLSLELEAPGADIVGFEHKPATPAQTSAMEAAKKQLAAAQTLFELPAAAGCTLQDANVAVEGEDHDHDADAKDHDHAHADAAANGDHAGPEHSSFRAEYSFDCKAPAALTSIGLGYFKAFAGAERLDVTVVTARQQGKLEASRANPRIDLAGLM